MSKIKHWKDPFDSLELKRFDDERGMLFEILRFKDFNIPPNGQLYTFSINSNKRRGDHYHLNKQEWFTCVHGSAIVLVTSSDGKDESYYINSKTPKIIYAAPGTSHALINKSDSESVIVSYKSSQHDPENADTYPKQALTNFKF